MQKSEKLMIQPWDKLWTDGRTDRGCVIGPQLEFTFEPGGKCSRKEKNRHMLNILSISFSITLLLLLFC